MPVTADRLLRSIGASGRYTGFDYAVYMIEQIVNAQRRIHLITKRLYPETAKHLGVKPHYIEHGLRTLISSCWKYGNRKAMGKYNDPQNSDHCFQIYREQGISKLQ